MLLVLMVASTPPSPHASLVVGGGGTAYLFVPAMVSNMCRSQKAAPEP